MVVTNMLDLNERKILLLLRNGIAFDWDSLCINCGLNPSEYYTGHMALYGILKDLKEAGLISFATKKMDDSRGVLISGEIKFLKRWDKIQNHCLNQILIDP
jgi:hypothetical protein